jgi:P pilus assembly chaperone PapD
MGYCRFEFKAADGRKLVVSTVNNQKGQQPILYRNWIEKNP